MSKRFFLYFFDVPSYIPEPTLVGQGRGRQGQGLSAHHWTEISIPKIETEIRTLNVLLEITNDIVSLLPVRSWTCLTGDPFSQTAFKAMTVQARRNTVGHVRHAASDVPVIPCRTSPLEQVYL